MSDEKPREFWIDSDIIDAYDNEKEALHDHSHYPLIHVIEKSAYDQLQAQLIEKERELASAIRLRDEYGTGAEEAAYLWLKEIKAEQAKAQKLVEALERINKITGGFTDSNYWKDELLDKCHIWSDHSLKEYKGGEWV